MKAAIVFALFLFASSASTESSAQPVEGGRTPAAPQRELPACGPELDEAILLASAAERRKDADLNMLVDYLLWVEFEYDDGAMEEAEFLEEMAQGEADYALALAFKQQAAALHADLKELSAACPAQ